MYESDQTAPALAVVVATGVTVGIDQVLAVVVVLVISAVVLFRMFGRRNREPRA